MKRCNFFDLKHLIINGMDNAYQIYIFRLAMQADRDIHYGIFPKKAHSSKYMDDARTSGATFL